MIYLHAMYMMSCCYDLKRNKQFSCEKSPTLFSKVCASKALSACLLIQACCLLLPLGFLLCLGT